MNTDTFVLRTLKRASFISALCVAGAVWANPIDPVSNPKRLDYPEVHMNLSDYDEPFQRNGLISQPEVFKQVVPGMVAEDVVALIGRPLNGGDMATQDTPWDYNFTFRMRNSEHYIVCQYKVVFDQEHKVERGFWRRHQCLDIVDGTAG